MNRNLDGTCFRIKRNEEWIDICFSDMTEDEMNNVMKNRSIEWLQEMCRILAGSLKGIGNAFDITLE